MVQLLDSDIKTREVLDWKGVHLIHYMGSSCSQKVRIFLNLKGIDWEWLSLDGCMTKAPLGGEKDGQKPDRSRQERGQAQSAGRGRRAPSGVGRGRRQPPRRQDGRRDPQQLRHLGCVRA